MPDKRFVHIDEARAVVDLTGKHEIIWVPTVIHLTDPARTFDQLTLCGLNYGQPTPAKNGGGVVSGSGSRRMRA